MEAAKEVKLQKQLEKQRQAQLKARLHDDSFANKSKSPDYSHTTQCVSDLILIP